jgi:uncharacterized protein (DUF58 family)
MVREVLDRPSQGGTDLERGLDAVLATLKRRSVLFFISDFLSPVPVRALKAASARHDLILVEIVDPRDQEIPAVGPVVLRDAETGETALVSGKRLARRHAEERRREREDLTRWTRKLGIDRLELRTDRPYINTLMAFFEQRKKRLRR